MDNKKLENNSYESSPTSTLSEQDLLTQIERAFADFLIDKAYALMKLHEKTYSSQSPSQTSTQQSSQTIGDTYRIELFQEIDAFYQEMLFMVNSLNDDKDWICEQQTPDSKMSYKFIPNSPTISMRWEETMNVPVVNACSLIYQIELFNQWVPFCQVSKNIKQINKAHKIAYLCCQLPIINNRDCYVNGYGIDRLSIDDTFLLCCKSIQNDKSLQMKYDINISEGKNVVLDIKYFSMQIKIIDVNTFKMKVVCNVDPQINFIPKPMLNFCIRKVAKMVFTKFIDIAKNIKGTEWEKAMNSEEDKEFYDWMRGRFQEYHSEKQKQKL